VKPRFTAAIRRAVACSWQARNKVYLLDPNAMGRGLPVAWFSELAYARVMMQTARASRVYTTSQIAPLLEHQQSRVYRAIESVHQVLDEHLPAALQKAIDRLPSQREKMVLQFLSPIMSPEEPETDNPSVFQNFSTFSPRPLMLAKLRVSERFWAFPG
jgi:hypothetical protein